jgi:hypothetical protein
MIDHHAANFMASTKFEGMHHVAYECRDPSHVITLVDIDRMTDGPKGCWEPRPWHETFPMYPKTWEIDALTANLWGPFDPSLLAR